MPVLWRHILRLTRWRSPIKSATFPGWERWNQSNQWCNVDFNKARDPLHPHHQFGGSHLELSAWWLGASWLVCSQHLRPKLQIACQLDSEVAVPNLQKPRCTEFQNNIWHPQKNWDNRIVNRELCCLFSRFFSAIHCSEIVYRATLGPPLMEAMCLAVATPKLCLAFWLKALVFGCLMAWQGFKAVDVSLSQGRFAAWWCMKWNTAKHYRNVDLVWGQDGQGLLTHHWPNYMWYCMWLCVRVPVSFFLRNEPFRALGIKKGLFASHLVNANAVDAVSNGHVWSRHHCGHTPKNWLIGVLCWDQICLQGQCPLQATMAGQISWLWFFLPLRVITWFVQETNLLL